MKRLALVAVAALTLAIALAAPAISENDNHKSTPPEPRCLLPAFESFSARVWAPKHWERGDPPASTIAAAHRRIGCAPTKSHRKAMKHTWKRDRHRFYARRETMLRRERITPFYGCTSIGGCGWWALPIGIVECESGGNYNFPYGAYSILDPAWREWGGQTAHAGEASKAEQDRVAAVGWDIYGEGAWECKSNGSTSWP